MSDAHDAEHETYLAALVAAADLIDHERARTGNNSGEVVCPSCGGVLRFWVSGPRSARAICRDCEFRFIS